MSDDPVVTPRRARALWAAVLVAVLLLGGGVALTVRGIDRSSGPDGAVRGYFEALEAADAPTALAYGTVPVGTRALLTSAVLREQQRIAPIRDVSIGPVEQASSRANVRVHYTVDFPDAPQRVADEVPLDQVDGDWRLVQVALPTQLTVLQAAQRATILGGSIPQGTLLVFPGAVPIRFDTPYLQLRPRGSIVTFGADPTTQVLPTVSEAGRAAAVAAVSKALRFCLDGRARDLRCPQPDDRVVPGSLRGTVAGSLGDQLTIGIGLGAPGSIDVSGEVQVTGRYRLLTFANTAESVTGTVVVRLHAVAYATVPVHILWTNPS